MAHLSMTLDLATALAATSTYYPLDGRGGVDTVAAGAEPVDEALDLIDENNEVALRSIYGYAAAAVTMTVHHGNGDAAYSVFCPTGTIVSPDLAEAGVRILGRWYVSFDVASVNVVLNLLFDIENTP